MNQLFKKPFIFFKSPSSPCWILNDRKKIENFKTKNHKNFSIFPPKKENDFLNFYFIFSKCWFLLSLGHLLIFYWYLFNILNFVWFGTTHIGIEVFFLSTFLEKLLLEQQICLKRKIPRDRIFQWDEEKFYGKFLNWSIDDSENCKKERLNKHSVSSHQILRRKTLKNCPRFSPKKIFIYNFFKVIPKKITLKPFQIRKK